VESKAAIHTLPVNAQVVVLSRVTMTQLFHFDIRYDRQKYPCLGGGGNAAQGSGKDDDHSVKKKRRAIGTAEGRRAIDATTNATHVTGAHRDELGWTIIRWGYPGIPKKQWTGISYTNK